jgi:hypothetical protein
VNDEEYMEDIWGCFEETKNTLLDNLDKDVVMAWFCPADRIGHIFRSDIDIMKSTYEKLDIFAGEIKDKFDGRVLIFSDHGMEKLGKFGDHSSMSYGYWSSNEKIGLKNPRLVHLKDIIEDLVNGSIDPSRYSQEEVEEKEEKERKYEDDEKEIHNRLQELGYFD